MKNITKIEKNGQVFQITDEVAQRAIVELEGLINPLQIAKGGTGATNVIDANDNAGIFGISLSTGTSKTITMQGNLGLIFAKRGTNYYVGMVTYWDNSASVISSSGTVPTITKSANSFSVTIQNNMTGAMAITFISIPNVIV